MAIALHSAALAAEMCLAGATPDLFMHRLNHQLRPGMSIATLISRAIVSTTGRSLAPFALSLFPRATPWIAASTRIPKLARLPNPQPFLAAAERKNNRREAPAHLDPHPAVHSNT